VTNQDVTTRVHRANPVPSAEDLPSPAWSDIELLHVIDARREQMRELMNDPDLERAKQRPPRWRMPALVTVGAFVVALGVVGVAAFVGGDPEPDTAGTIGATTLAAPSTVAETTTPATTSPSDEPTPEQMSVVTRFYAAWSNGDGETMRALVAPGVELERGAGTKTLDEVIKEAELAAYLSETSNVTSCRLFSEIRVSCRVLVESVVTDTLDSGPMIFQANVQIENGLITRWQGDEVYYPRDLFSRFTDWVGEVYPDDRYRVSDALGVFFNTDLDPAFALQLLNEYDAFLETE